MIYTITFANGTTTNVDAPNSGAARRRALDAAMVDHKPPSMPRNGHVDTKWWDSAPVKACRIVDCKAVKHD